MRDREAVPVPDDPRAWAPMRPYHGRRTFDIVDPIVEPLWSGARVLAHVAAASPGGEAEVALIEELGADLAPELPELSTRLARAVMASDAIIDGVITWQVVLDGVGAAPVTEVRGSTTSLLMRNDAALDVVARGAGTNLGPDAPDGFIAVDLLRIDGSPLLDVPLLERKRLLESVVSQDELLRLSPHVRPPIETWVSTWKSLGLRGGIIKAANSRYRPGDDTIEWRLIERVGRR